MFDLHTATIASILLIVTGGAAQAAVYEVNTDGSVDRLDANPVTLPPPVKSSRQSHDTAASARAAAYHPIVAKAGAQYEVSPALIDAIARSESGYDQSAVSHARAVGIMQLMPGTARQLGVDATDAEANIRGGSAYLRYLLNRYDGDIVCTIAAYNAGPGVVSKERCVPRYRETIAYVGRVLDYLANAAN